MGPRHVQAARVAARVIEKIPGRTENRACRGRAERFVSGDALDLGLALPGLTSSHDNLTACLGIVAAILGLATSYGVDSLVRSVHGSESVPAPSPAKSLQPEDWVFADRPIERLDENVFPEHMYVVGRAAERLCLFTTELSPYKLPSLALVGDYGSGKTRLIRLKRTFHHEREVGAELGEVIVSRWQNPLLRPRTWCLYHQAARMSSTKGWPASHQAVLLVRASQRAAS